MFQLYTLFYLKIYIYIFQMICGLVLVFCNNKAIIQQGSSACIKSQVQCLQFLLGMGKTLSETLCRQSV